MTTEAAPVHTPGPWTVGPSEDGRPHLAINWAGGTGRSSCGYDSWGELATVWGSDDGLRKVSAEAKANARLIAAAPDLLEAAKLGLECAEGWIHDQLDGTSVLDDALSKLQPIRDAIAKAQG